MSQIKRLAPRMQARFRDFNEWTFRLEEGTAAPHEEPEARAARMAHLNSNLLDWSRYYLSEICAKDPGDFHEDLARRCQWALKWRKMGIKATDEAKRHQALAAVAEKELNKPNYQYHTLLAARHFRAAAYCHKRGNLRFIAEWARGHAKSVWVTLIIPLWLVANGGMRFMLLASYTEDQAGRLLDAIKEQLETNEKFIADYGEMYNPGAWSGTEFTTRTGIKFLGVGRGQTPRGARKKGSRPDYVVIDDIDKDSVVANSEAAQEVVSWIEKALIGTMEGGRGWVFIANNRYHPNCAFTAFVDRPGWVHSRVNLLNADGSIRWQQNFTEQDVAQLRADLSYLAFQAECMNSPVVAGSVHLPEWVTRHREALPLAEYVALCLYGDGAWSAKRTSDHKVWMLLGLRKPTGDKPSERLQVDILAVYNRQETEAQWMRWVFALAQRHPEIMKGWCLVEGIFNKANALYPFQAIAESMGMPQFIQADPRTLHQKGNKDTRIAKNAFYWEHGNIWWASHLVGTPDYDRTVNQYLSFTQGKRNVDDGPDCCEGAMHHLKSWCPPEAFRTGTTLNRDRFHNGRAPKQTQSRHRF